MRHTHTPATRVPLRDTPQVYGKISRVLHWTMAVLILWQFFGMGLRAIFGRQDWLAPFVGSHAPVGTVLFVLVILRALWALANRRNRPAHDGGLLGKAATAGHALLYALMLAIPGLALLRAWGSDRAFAPFGFQIFSAKTPEVEWTGNLAGALHGELGWFLLAVIAGHVLMVGVHQAMWRDGTLARMAGRRS
ncbi:cytochrome b [Paracoccus sp. (in: a-proteobacteria)]|uniref:cytochrome b n=1 Tax=Paracoccus sp. TaxID=267 RepID=UPI0035B197E4